MTTGGISTTAIVSRVAIIGVALLVAYLVPTEKDRAPRPTDARYFPGKLLEQSPLGDRVFVDHTSGPQYVFGRWKQPVRDLSFHIDRDWQLALRSVFTTKYWHYSSVNTDKYFVGAAVVKLGYANDAFIYVVDKTSPSMEKFEFTGRLPGDLGVTFASSSIDASKCTSFTTLSGEKIAFCYYDNEAEEWTIEANVTMVGANNGSVRPFEVALRLKREEALALLFPVGNDTLRPAYVHKGAGAPVTGWIRLGDDRLDVSDSATPALGAIDWTRSQALRCTRWNWASSSFKAKVTTTVAGQEPVVDDAASVGINLSRHVYDINNESQENAIWIDGKVYVLRGVDFVVPKTEPLTCAWTVKTPRVVTAESAESVKLTFTPSGGGREDRTHLLVIESDFVQPYGAFNGEVSFASDDGKTSIRVEVVDAFGVVEDHFALW